MTHPKLVALVAAVLVAAAAHAQPAAAAAAPTTKAAVAAEFVEGEVRKVDREAGKITLRHGEIRNLDMPAMSMVFQVKDAAVLDRFKAGDKVRFKAIEESGKYFVTEIAASK